MQRAGYSNAIIAVIADNAGNGRGWGQKVK
jgi:hypothetical protein